MVQVIQFSRRAALAIGASAAVWLLVATPTLVAQRQFENNEYISWRPFEDRTGFVSLFDGATLDGWDGNPNQWRVENGVIVGQSTEQFPVDSGNTFLIWKGGTPGDFELKLQFRFVGEAGNSGVQYRARMREDGENPWAISGYQADMNFANEHTGMLYEEAGRGRLAVRGMVTYVGSDGTPGIIGSINTQEALGELINPSEWTRLHIVARGNTLMHIVNDRLMIVVIDDDVVHRSMGGYIALQLHAGPPMRIEFRDIALKYL